MSITKTSDQWDTLAEQHEKFLEDPGYLQWLEQQKLNQEQEWDNINHLGQDGHSL